MTRDEYEHRKQRLEEQLRDGIALLQSAHRQQLRALDLVWMTTTEDDLLPPSRPAAAEPAPARSAPPPPPPPPQRRPPGTLEDEIEAALDKVPEIFDQHDLRKALTYQPDRGSLFRALKALVADGLLAVEESGRGKVATRYRKTIDADAPAEAS